MPEFRKILIVFAHPSLRKSQINRQLLASARKVEGVTVSDLYEEYPDFMIDVKREQELLNRHDVILFQHPMYWYSCPALLKEWLDLVLEYGYAYGETGRALEGKWQGSVISTGGAAEAYRRSGANRFSIRELLAPFEQTASLCRMRWLPPFLVQGSFELDRPAVLGAAAAYRELLEKLRDPGWDLEQIQSWEQMNGPEIAEGRAR